jgi:hypothetical protein
VTDFAQLNGWTCSQFREGAATAAAERADGFEAPASGRAGVRERMIAASISEITRR